MTTPVPPSAEPVVHDVDQRPRQLLERYASLVGTVVMEAGDGLLQFDVPPQEQVFWGNVSTIQAALIPEALDDEPGAEILTVGSPLMEKLLTAIRARGTHEVYDVLSATTDVSAAAAVLTVAVADASVTQPEVELSLLPIGRLLARVSIKAGAKIEERLIESVPIDFTTGAPLPSELVPHLIPLTGPKSPSSSARRVEPRKAEELLPAVFKHLEQQLANEITRLRTDAEKTCATEVQRLQRYYDAMALDVEANDEPDATAHARKAFEAEFARRKAEEEDRARMRIIVHPIQMTRWHVIAQRASWTLSTPKGRKGVLSATRLLTGPSEWSTTCNACSSTPTTVAVCKEGHAACQACSELCTVCGETACRMHGLSTCGVGAHAVCRDDARTCGSCGASHCVTHGGQCRLGDHLVCPTCAISCARCGVEMCRSHATQTAVQNPRGARWLCGNCVVSCEGGSNEPVGLDEAVRCSACERYICETHATACAVDGKAYCSKHLRRSDRSGRLACEQHRGSCADEPGSILASDEVAECKTCGRSICDVHGADCETDRAVHCLTHLAPLADKSGARGCEVHRTTCHVDNVTYSIAGTTTCPVCGKAACRNHQKACPNCARHVCIKDFGAPLCSTCARLADLADPPDDLVSAALQANGGEPVQAKAWRFARDATMSVVELDLGWTRRMVFTVATGDTTPKTVVRHSVLGSSRKR